MVTRRRSEQHPIKRLVDHGTITREQGVACYEMNKVIYAITNVGGPYNCYRDRDFGNRDTNIERFNVAKLKQLFEDVLKEMGDDAQMIFDMIEGAASFTTAARKRGVRLTTAKAKLFMALDLWIEMKAAACY